ncbi:MAG: hypothetical protein PHC75_09845 [Burkholderiales bacterium]|nr:hypothetical protein [Burkholderiales bacterium]
MKIIYYTLFIACSSFLAACSSGQNDSNNTTQMSTYAYITNEGSSSDASVKDNSYTKCLVTQSGKLSNCNTNTIKGINKPTDIKFYNNNAYIINNGDNSYIKCPTLADGDLDETNCQTSPITGANGALKISFQESNAYIINHNANSYVQCTINESGDLQACATHNNLPGAHVGLTSISFNNNMAYFTADLGHPIQCGYNGNNGNLENCKNIVSSALVGINGISFNNNYAYLGLDLDSEYSLCSISNNDLTCSLHKTNPATGDYFSGIAFNNNIAYLLHSQDNSYSQCNVTNNGILTNCTTDDTSNLDKPSAIAFYSVKTQPTPNPSEIKTHFYGLDTIALSYVHCSIDINGDLANDCLYKGIPIGARGISFNNNIAYLMTPSGDFSKGSRYTKCSVQPTGVLSNCKLFYGKESAAIDEPFYNTQTSAIKNGKIYMTLIQYEDLENSSGYSLCDIDNKSNELINCSVHRGEISMNYPYNISINNNYVYITSSIYKQALPEINTYTKCEISSNDGTLINCTSEINDKFNHATNIIFHNGFAYVGAHNKTGTNSYTICKIGQSGILENCQYPDRTNGLESGIFQIAINDNEVYITYDSQKYSTCQIDSNGLWDNCVLHSNFFKDDYYVGPMAFYKYQTN